MQFWLAGLDVFHI